MLRCGRYGMLALLGVLLALPGTGQGQDAPPARRIIARGQPMAASLPPLPPGAADGTSYHSIQPAVYRPGASGDPVRQAALGPSDGGEAAATTAAVAMVSLHVENGATSAAGRTHSYTIVVRNPGLAVATHVGVESRLPPGARLIGAEARPIVQGDRLAWDLGDLGPGLERRIAVEFAPARSSDDAIPSPTATFGVARTPRPRVVEPPLEVRIQGPTEATLGSSARFRVQLANRGENAQSHVLVRVQLSAGLYHRQLGKGDQIEAEVALGPGETKSLPLEIAVTGDGRQTLSATAAAASGPRASAEAVLEVRSTADAARVVPGMTVDVRNRTEGLILGGEAKYEIQIANLTAAPQTGVRVLVDLPEGLEPLRADGPTEHSLSPTGAIFETLSRLGPRETAVFHVVARAKRAGVQRVRVEVNADRQAQPITGELNSWVAPGKGR